MLGAPLDLIMVRKIGIPGHPELAAAAIIDGQDPEVVVNERVCTLAGVRRQYIETMARQELAEIERRAGLYLKGRPRVPIAGRTAIIVDDGIATGTTMRAVINALRRKKPKSLVLAVPVAPRETVEALRGQADDIICLESPDPFVAVGVHYDDFRQVSDAEVIELIEGTRAAEKDDRAKVLDQV
jgi:putative phosphoribosyl transferase